MVYTNHDRKVIGFIQDESKEVHRFLREIIENMQSIEGGI